MFRRTLSQHGWHYVHPRTGRPLKQPRSHGDPRYINNEACLINGQWGLITADFGVVTINQLEEARLAILQRLPGGGIFNLVMHTDMYEEFPMGHKPQEARMGKGKTAIHHYAYKFTTGIPLFEIEGTRQMLKKNEAEVIFLKARTCLSLETKVVPQGRVDEYIVFK